MIVIPSKKKNSYLAHSDVPGTLVYIPGNRPTKVHRNDNMDQGKEVNSCMRNSQV